MSLGYGVAVVVALSAWLVLSALNQLPLRWMGRIKRRDYFGLIPRWTFFAPNPANTDYQLYYRDRLRDGRLTDWREAPVRGEKPLRVAVWNPEKRRQKALSDFMRSIARSLRNAKGDADTLQLNLGYIALLHFTSNSPHDAESVTTQFAVWQTYGFRPSRKPRLVMHSRFHALP